MARAMFSIAVGLIAVGEVASAQRTLPPDSRFDAPATFKTEACVARIVPGSEASSRFPVPAGEITIVIDKRYRMYVRPLPSIVSSTGIAFSPHDFLCDGKTHHVEVRWRAGESTTHQVTLPVSRPAGSRPATR